ncbi:RHS repeat-associated core domain-containing protein [Paenibacillus elgii]|uniref:RHS repeat-associated core domain-containing protein n=1 Tax=Paenibacillus elgii TaxID=189691 RepID=UPI001CB8A2BB|nr:RHS repeat-associated core domain-containing protein [Paenibacillus elgii]
MDPEGGIRAWQYDELGRVKGVVGPDQTVTRFAYDERHRISEVYDPKGAVTRLLYDDQDNLIEITLPDGTSGKWAYNHRGECLQETNPLGAKQVLVYDGLGRVVRSELPDGNVIKLKYDAYDEVILAEDNQHRVAFEYTPLGKLTWREERGKRVQLSYSKEEELTEVINERGERYVLERDANGSIVRETGFDGIVRQYVRSPAGLLQKVERPGGRWTAYSHDVMGHVTQVEYSDGLVETFRYNRMGELLETANPFAAVKLDYDRAGRVIKEWRDAYWVASQYDEMGNRTEVSSSLGAQVTMERDILGQVSQMRAQQQRGGDVAQSGGTPWTAQMRYDALGQEIERLLPGGVISSWQYDIAGRPERHSVKAGGRETRRRKYTWDVNNRLKTVLNELTGKKTHYGYDDFGTLIGATDDFGKIFRMADNVGNLYSDGHKTDRTYGAGGRLLEFNGTKYSYDEEGNLTEKIDPDGTHWRYEYYGNNMMSKVIRPDGQEVTFTYDSLGRRIEKHFNGVVHCYVWDGNIILHEWKAEKAQVDNCAVWNEELPKDKQRLGGVLNPDGLVTWIFEDGTFHPAAKITPEGSYSIVTDHLGTPVEMYDDAGEKAWSCELDIYGKVRRQDLLGERSVCPFRYPGQYEDEETGMYYNRFRYYSPHEGMYTQQDPIGLTGGLRLYGYIHDPNAWVDVFGLKGANSQKCAPADGTDTDELASFFKDLYKNNISKDGKKIMSKKTKKGVVKEEYIFKNKNEAQNFGRKLVGLDASRIYDQGGKWIGWEGKRGKLYWGHNDWGKGVGLSNFPHLNYDLNGVKGHLFLKDKIINRKMWNDFVRSLTEELKK